MSPAGKKSPRSAYVATSIAVTICASGCQESTQLLVVVDVAPELSERIKEVVAWSSLMSSDSEPTASATSFGADGEVVTSFPFSFGVASGDADGDTAVFVRVRGLGEGGRSEVCVETRFEPQQRTLVPIMLQDWCAGGACSQVPCPKLDPAACPVNENDLLSSARTCGARARLCGCTAWEVGPELEISTATTSLYGASFSPDRLDLYQSLNEGTRWNLYSRRRSSTDSDTFGPPQRLSELNTCQGFDETGCVNIRFVTTADGLTAYFGSHRRPSDSLDIMRSVRASTTVPFESSSRIPHPTRSPTGGTYGIYSAEDLEPWISADGARLYYATTNDPSENSDKDFAIFYREWDPNNREFDEVEYPVAVRSADGLLHGRSPSLSQDELLILFHRTVCTANCQEYVHYATRPHRDGVFELQGSFIEDLVGENVRGPYLSADGCELTYTRGEWPDWRIMKRRITGPGGSTCN